MKLNLYISAFLVGLVLIGKSSDSFAASCIACEEPNKKGHCTHMNHDEVKSMDRYTPESELFDGLVGRDRVKSAYVAENRGCVLRIYDCIYERNSFPWCKGRGQARRFIRQDTDRTNIQTQELGGFYFYCDCNVN